MRLHYFAVVGWTTLVVMTGAVAQEPARVDPDIQPAQFVEPGTRGQVMGGAVPDPATPVVRIQVRTPSHIAPGKSVPYKIVVTNTSSATAYKVVVRHPVPEGVTAPTKTEPPPDRQTAPAPAKTTPKDYLWDFAELKAGQSKEIVIEYPVVANVKSVRATAFVSFEHGQAVTTDVDKPKLAVNKTAPEKASAGEPITVRVEISNTSRVPVQAVKLVEQVPVGFVYAGDGDSEAGTTPGQRIWNLGTLVPGQRKFVEYRVTSKDAAELATTSQVSSKDTPAPEMSTSTTKVLAPKMQLAFTGPPTVAAGDTGQYTINVTNTGSLALANIHVAATVPSDCTVKNMTSGGQRYKDQIVWELPLDRNKGPLKPGETAQVRFRLKAATSGARRIEATAEAGKGLEQSQTVQSAFQGSSLLQYKTAFEPGIVTVGKSAQMTYVVDNSGDEVARNVVLRIEVPKGIRPTEISPSYKTTGSEVTFNPVSIPARGELKFTVTYMPEQVGRPEITFKLFADSLETPLVKTAFVTVREAAR